MAKPIDEANKIVSELAPLIQSYEGVNVLNFRFAPYHPDALVQNVGHDTIERMKEMAAYRGPLSVKRAAMFHRGWTIDAGVPGDTTADEIASALEWHCNNIIDNVGNVTDFRTFLFNLTEALHIGFSVVEPVYRYVEDGPPNVRGQFGFAGFYPKRAKAIGFQLDPVTLKVVALTHRSMSSGLQTDIPPTRVVRYTYNPEHGLPFGRGDWRAAYKHWWVLDTIEKFHAIALEIFGSPFIAVKGNLGDTQATAALLEILKKIRQGAPAVFPQGIEYEIVQLQNGALDAFDTAKRWHAEQIKQAVIGSSLTMEQGMGIGSYALGAVHADTSQYFMGQARRDIETVVSAQLFRRWTIINYGPDSAQYTPRLNLGKWDEKDMAAMTQSLSMLMAQGVVHRREPFVRRILGLPPIDSLYEQMIESERMEKQNGDDQSNDEQHGETDNVSDSEGR